MASELIFLDSFDHYLTPHIFRKWTGGFGAFGTGNIVPGRTGNGMSFSGPGNVFKTFGLEYPQVTVGCAYTTTVLGTDDILRLFNLGFPFPYGNTHISLAGVGDGRLRVQVNDTEAQSSPSAFTLLANNWYYLELQAKIVSSDFGPGTDISYTARVNGTTILSGTLHIAEGDIRLQVGWASLYIGTPGGGISIYDDLYITDTEFFGDVKIFCLFPNADGSQNDWTPSAATGHFYLTKEHDPDDNTTYVGASATGTVELYNLDDISGFTGTILGAQGLNCMEKTDAGLGAVQMAFKSGATIYYVPTAYYPSADNYLYDRHPFRKSPFTSSNWTVSEINALQQGAKRTL